jgi:hypothetical protein
MALRFNKRDFDVGERVLPNPEQWIIGAKYFVKLIEENSKFKDIVKLKMVTDIIAVGEEILRALQNFKTKDVESNIRVRNDVFVAIYSNYTIAHNKLLEIITKIRDEFHTKALCGQDPDPVRISRYMGGPVVPAAAKGLKFQRENGFSKFARGGYRYDLRAVSLPIPSVIESLFPNNWKILKQLQVSCLSRNWNFPSRALA